MNGWQDRDAGDHVQLAVFGGMIQHVIAGAAS
jgi:hypothetical protein